MRGLRTKGGLTVAVAGTAASHGCLALHMPDVENLYQYVVVGMPVEIRN